MELFGDEIERITTVDTLTGEQLADLDELVIFPATHYVAGEEADAAAIARIEAELGERLAWFEKRESCSRRSACGCGPRTTWRCWPRWGCARA